MKSASSWRFSAVAFFVVAGYWFISFLIARGNPGTGSSNAWMLVFAGAFFTIACSLAAQGMRR